MRHSAICLLLTMVGGTAWGADEDIFSGPQVGEKLTNFKARGVIGELADEEFDIVAEANGRPLALFFVHDVTRPSVGLTRLLMDYAAKRSEDGLHAAVVFLSNDPTDTKNWMKRASHALPKNVAVGISEEGQEGPGAYGLNRNVALTVLVGEGNKVTANFALVQPSVQADAPKIAKAIVDVLGGGKVPSLAELGARGYSEPAGRMDDARLESLLRAVIQKTASEEEVTKAAESVEAYVADKKAAQQHIGSIAKRIINGGKLSNYGTATAQEYLKKWAKAYGGEESSRQDDSARSKER